MQAFANLQAEQRVARLLVERGVNQRLLVQRDLGQWITQVKQSHGPCSQAFAHQSFVTAHQAGCRQNLRRGKNLVVQCDRCCFDQSHGTALTGVAKPR
ncbi:hypothetical protein D3C76_1240060 [compost metagenome]